MWWKELIGYQIYPRSFKDSNGDGIGDLRGVIEKLDYLKDLGVDLLWISPFFKSPNDDNGYDISDYQDILEEFGTLEDFDELLSESHKRGMKLIIDLVINHTSDEHPWFIESRSSKDNEKRDWYIWSEKPNNWESIFKGSAWEKCPITDEYYMHLFSKKQPDLNWENKNVRDKLYKMINWWLDKGIDGFRVDAISHIKKEPGFPDLPNPLNEKYVESFDMHMNVKGIQKHLKELKENTFDKYDIVTVGEANGVSANEADDWVGNKNGKFNMIFQFEHLKLWDYEKDVKFSPKAYKKVLGKWQNALDTNGWNALFIENHDIPRSTSTWGNDKEFWEKSAKSFGTAYFLQKGTPFIYQGQEIGMTNTVFKSIEDFQDVRAVNEANEKLELGVSKEEILEILSKTSRDNSRTPMQWDSSENSGFSSGKPWLKVNENYEKINVQEQESDENSILNYYKKLIKLKKGNEVLTHGKFNLILENDEDIFAYTRGDGDEKYLILANLTKKNREISLKNYENIKNHIVLTNYNRDKVDFKNINIKPYECFVVKFI